MCGIVGIIDRDNVHLLSAMNELLTHRGPNDSGSFVDKDNGVALAMRRLSIIDLEGGKQPMPNEDESLWVVCNGEIYNSPELRLRLAEKGHRFRTKNSDVEVLLHLYEEKGSELLNDLNGMYAFVIYDKAKKVFFGARDRTGIKPLYYTFKNGKFAFASELKCLLLLPWVSREIDFTSLNHYLSLQFVPAPQSIFNDIKKLQAGHFFIYNLNKNHLELKRYWCLNVRDEEDRPVDEWAEIVKEKLREAVKRWTLSDVPIACSLSGGLDSSAIVGLLAESGEKDIRTYSLGFESLTEQDCNELPLARTIAQRWGTKHHEVILRPEKVLSDLDRMVWHLDEPYGGGLPSWYIYELIGKDVKVCLTGTGGDELFGNYGKFRIYERPKWYRFLRTIRDTVRSQSYRTISDAIDFPSGHYYPFYFSNVIKDKFIFSKSHEFHQNTEAYIETIWNSSGSDSARNAVAYVDFHLQLPEEFLLVTDRFSMANSVEARTPFLDHTLIECVFRIPPLIRTGWKEPKSFLKYILKDLLPQEILNAPKKGFILPLSIWTRRELRPLIEDLLSPEYLKQQGIFSNEVYHRIVRPHLTSKRDYTQQVWTLLMFQLWYRRYIKQ